MKRSLVLMLSIFLIGYAATPGITAATAPKTTPARLESALLGNTVPRMNLCVATFNIKACSNGTKLNEVAAAIKESAADIVGLQEVDMVCKRSGLQDQPALLSHLTGLPYYYFSKAMDYSGGQYGTLILSRYKITQGKTIALTTAQGIEPRSMGFCEMDINDCKLNVLNTHLSCSTAEATHICLKSLAQNIQALGLESFILLGDFNTVKTVVAPYFPQASFAWEEELNTMAGCAIDQILFTKPFIAENVIVWDAIAKEVSDHNLVSCNIAFTAP